MSNNPVSEGNHSSDMLLHFAFPDSDGQVVPLLFRNPTAIFEARCIEDVLPALREIQTGVDRGLWAAGYLAYDAAPAFDPDYRTPGIVDAPLLWFGLFSEPVCEPPPEPAGPVEISDWTPEISREEYDGHIEAIRGALSRGESYQVNYTIRLRARIRGDDLALFHRLCAAQPGCYAAYLRLGRYRVLSASPELFFHRKGDWLVTRPMKGTASRGRWPEEDAERTAWLAASPKNRAENTTIVDLMRNDLSRIALPGAVHTPLLYSVERYRTVLQMTSTITARLECGIGIPEVFQALFPAASITGAPRISTMDLIARHEASARKVYCGTIGLIRPGGEATFSVAIRTALVDARLDQVEYGVGGGITWDSCAGDEYNEALLKARILDEDEPPFGLLETLALEEGQYYLLERHLSRMLNSADYFQFPVLPSDLCKTLAETAAVHPQGRWRVRLLLSRNGVCRSESAPLSDCPPGPFRVRPALSPVDPEDRFLYHKTTCRRVYDRLLREADPQQELFDLLLWNIRGELTEFTRGNLVADLDGACWTPPRTCGLLAGTLREELLARGAIQERVLFLDDLARASRIWFLNSVRGQVEVLLEWPG